MAITNGYTTLAELKRRWADIHTYTGTTFAFANATSTISDSTFGFKRFQAGDYIEVSGTDDNDGLYTIATGNTPASIITSEALTDEAAGDTATIAVINPVSDEVMESVIEAASRAIDYYCDRVFYTSAATARTFTPCDSRLLFVDDLLSIDANGLVTDDDGDRTYENTWATTDYLLLPENAATDGEPYTMIEIDPYGSHIFPCVRRGVKITGTWGYAATVPKPIAEICLLLSEQMMARKDAIFGVIGTPGGEAMMRIPSNILREDAHLQMLLAGYRRSS